MTELQRLSWQVASKLHNNGIERTGEEVIQHCLDLRKDAEINDRLLIVFLKTVLRHKSFYEDFLLSISYQEVIDE